MLESIFALVFSSYIGLPIPFFTNLSAVIDTMRVYF